MKSKKMKKAFLFFASIASVGAPIATIVSCGKEDEKKIIIKYTWSANGKQITALKPIVEYYNKHVKKEGDLKVELKHIEGGYGKAVDTDLKDIKDNHMSSVANLVIDYPDSLGKIKDFALDFGGINANFHKYFESKFIQNQIEGQKNITESSLFAVPLAKSTGMLTISIPVFAKWEKDGVIKFDAKNTGIAKQLGEKVTKYIKKTDNDISDVDKKWGNPKSGFSVFTIKDETLTNYDKLFAFAKEIGAIYELAANKNNKPGEIHVVANDAPANLLYLLYNAKQGYKPEEFLFHKKDGKFDYSYLKDKESKGGKIYNSILQNINDAITQNGALSVGGDGKYSSQDFVKHKLALQIGSTAGYSHNFEKVGKDSIALLIGKKAQVKAHNDKIIVAPNAKNKKKKAIAQTNDKYHNPVYAHDYSGKVGKHDIKLVDEAATKAVKVALEEKTKDKELIVILVNKSSKINNVDGTKAFNDKKKGDFFLYTGKKAEPPKNNKKTLGENEIIATLEPYQSDSGKASTKNQILSQGPSILGIKHDDEEDKQTVKFLSWLFNSESKMIDPKDKNRKVTPIVYFNKEASYITPFKGAFSTANRNNYSRGNIVAFDAFAKATQDDGYVFDNPATFHSNAIRKQLTSSIKSLYEQASANKAINNNDIFDRIKANIGTIVD